MESHKVLKEAGFNVDSYGTGSAVRLPGVSIDRPNVYPFGTPYDFIYKDLERQNARLFTSNGLLGMLDRNRKLKKAPEKWQENSAKNHYDFVFTCEERCFDSVCEDLLSKGGVYNKIVHVINVDIKDDDENAKIGGKGILELANALSTAAQADDEEPFEDLIPGILSKWQANHPNLPLLYTPAFY